MAQQGSGSSSESSARVGSSSSAASSAAKASVKGKSMKAPRLQKLNRDVGPGILVVKKKKKGQK